MTSGGMNLESQILYLTNRERQLALEVATSSPSGGGRRYWMKACRELQRVQEQLRDLRAIRAWELRASFYVIDD